MSVIRCILTFLTLPGAYAHAFAEHVLLKCTRTPVEDSAYLQRNELCGHVEHKPVRSLGAGLALCMAPGLLAAALSVPMLWAGMLFLRQWGVTLYAIQTGGVSGLFVVCAALLYLAFALLCNLFPTVEDALFLSEARREKSIPIRLLTALPVLFVRIGAWCARWGVWHLLCAASILCPVLISF